MHSGVLKHFNDGNGGEITPGSVGDFRATHPVYNCQRNRARERSGAAKFPAQRSAPFTGLPLTAPFPFRRPPAPLTAVFGPLRSVFCPAHAPLTCRGRWRKIVHARVACKPVFWRRPRCSVCCAVVREVEVYCGASRSSAVLNAVKWSERCWSGDEFCSLKQ